MRIKVVSKGETEFTADGVYQEQPIGIAIASGDEAHIRSEIIDCTDTERSDMDHDEHATVTEDDGTVLWSGWLDGREEPAPAEAIADAQPRRTERLGPVVLCDHSPAELGVTVSGEPIPQAADEARAELENQVARGDRLEGQNEDLRAIITEMATAIRAEMHGNSHIRRAEVTDWTTRGGVEFDIYAEGGE